MNDDEWIIDTEDIIIYRNQSFPHCRHLKIVNACCCIFTSCSFVNCESMQIVDYLETSPIFFYCLLTECVRREDIQVQCNYIDPQKIVCTDWRKHKEVPRLTESGEMQEDLENTREIMGITLSYYIRNNLLKYFS